MQEPDARAERLALLAVWLGAISMRLAAVWRNPVIFDDGPRFIDIANALGRGDLGSSLAHPYHPLYPALIWLSPGSPEAAEWVGIAWSLIGGSMSVLALWWLLRPGFGATRALVASALLAVHPYAVRFSADVQSDQVYLALFLLACGLLWRALSRRDAALAFAVGIVTALAYLTRPEGVGVLVVGIALISGAALRGSISLRRSSALATAMLGGFALLALPYMRSVWTLSGQIRLSQKKSVAGLFGLDRLLEDSGPIVWTVGIVAILSFLLLALTLAMAQRSPQSGWAKRVASLRRERMPASLPAGITAVLVAAGVIGSPAAVVELLASATSTLRPELVMCLVVSVVLFAVRRVQPGGRALYYGALTGLYAVVLFGLLVTAGYVSRRHFLPPMVLLLGYVADGGLAIAAWLERRFKAAAADPPSLRWVLAVVLLLVCIALPKTFRDHRSEQVAARLAAEWVRTQATTGDRLSSLRPKSAYYADLLWVPLHDVNGIRAGADLRRLGTRWILAEKHQLDSPAGRVLAVAPASGQRFDLVYEIERNGHRALIFEVIETGADGPSGTP